MPKEAASRRQFLKKFAMLIASGAAAPVLESFLQASAASKYKIGAWTGDDFVFGHRMRDGYVPPCPDKCERSVDFVIVGGGISGLTTAYYLKDHDFLLLEQFAELGGESRGRSYRGIDYSLGAAYMGSVEGPFGELFSELALKPARIEPAKNAWYWEKKWFRGVTGNDQVQIYKEFKRLISECKPVWKNLPTEYCSGPADISHPDVARLDATPFSSYLQGYDPKFIALMDRFTQSALCGPTSTVSALAGFYAAEDLVSPSYVFKGGNPAIAGALVKKLNAGGKDRIHGSAFVWSILPKGDHAEVIYSDGKGEGHRICCRRVIITAPPLVSGRIVRGLDDKAVAMLLSSKYGSYLVANFLMPKKIFSGTYDNWVGPPFDFADVIVAERPYELMGDYKAGMGSVLTAYQPYPPSSPGRAMLLAGNREALTQTFVQQLGKLVDHLGDSLGEVVLSRWGHAMVVPVPGFFKRLGILSGVDTTPVILAHSSAAGLPSAEAAILAARGAADRALGIKHGSQPGGKL